MQFSECERLNCTQCTGLINTTQQNKTKQNTHTQTQVNWISTCLARLTSELTLRAHATFGISQPFVFIANILMLSVKMHYSLTLAAEKRCDSKLLYYGSVAKIIVDIGSVFLSSIQFGFVSPQFHCYILGWLECYQCANALYTCSTGIQMQALRLTFRQICTQVRALLSFGQPQNCNQSRT